MSQSGTLASQTPTQAARNRTNAAITVQSTLGASMNNLKLQGAASNFRTQGGSTMMPPGTVVTLQPSNWKLGQIVKVQHLVPSRDRNETDKKYRLWSDSLNDYICPKVRFAIVVAIYPSRMIVLPMYSCHMQGVQNKDTSYQLTSLSVFNPVTADHKVKSLLTKEHLMVNTGRAYSPGTHIRLTDPWTVEYKSKIVAAGELTKDRTSLLLRRYKIAQAMAYSKDSDAYYVQKVHEDLNPSKLGSAGFVMTGPGTPSAAATAYLTTVKACTAAASGVSYASAAR